MANPIRTACPDVPTLERLLLGRIAASGASALEEHVEACTRCAEIARSLPSEDALVKAMRGPDPTEALPQRELIDAVLPLLKRLRPRDATTTWPVGSGQGQPTGTVAANPAEFLAAPQAPDELGRLGPYRVLRQLGAGGMGVVFLAEDPRLHRQIALKVIRPDLVLRSDVCARFLREAQAIAAVEHDNIVAIHHVGEEGGAPFLVMPLLRGRTLEERLREAAGPLAVDEILRIGREIAVGLAAAHERGLIHRDIKPANIWLEQKDEGGGRKDEKRRSSSFLPPPSSCRVKILDFGLAQAVQGDDAGQSSEGVVVGTPAYMSPEQGRGLPTDARSDLFSLGCVLYRMATGRPAFQGDDLIGILMSVVLDVPPAPRDLNPALFDEPDRRLVLQRGGDPEQTVDLKTGHTFPLLPGKYDVRLAGDRPGRRRLMPAHFHVKEGEASVIALRLVGRVSALRTVLRRRGGRTRRATDRELDFASAVVIDVQVQLGTELTGREGFQFTDDGAGTGSQLGQVALRTEAAVGPSAFGQAQDAEGLPRAVIQRDDNFTGLARHAAGDFDFGRGGFQAKGRKG